MGFAQVVQLQEADPKHHDGQCPERQRELFLNGKGLHILGSSRIRLKGRRLEGTRQICAVDTLVWCFGANKIFLERTNLQSKKLTL